MRRQPDVHPGVLDNLLSGLFNDVLGLFQDRLNLLLLFYENKSGSN